MKPLPIALAVFFIILFGGFIATLPQYYGEIKHVYDVMDEFEESGVISPFPNSIADSKEDWDRELNLSLDEFVDKINSQDSDPNRWRFVTMYYFGLNKEKYSLKFEREYFVFYNESVTCKQYDNLVRCSDNG